MNDNRMTKSRCPRCASQGKDLHHDNLATYPDGHQYCFSCGYLVPATGTQKLHTLHGGFNSRETPAVRERCLPGDSTTNIPRPVKEWALSFITENELKRHRAVWSTFHQRLIFPIWDGRVLLGWIGRNFGVSGPKWLINGDIKGKLYILPSMMNQTSLVLVEDLISAIKVSRVFPCAPVFGAHVDLAKLVDVKRGGYKRVFIWLDPDKQFETLQAATKASALGLEMFPIWADKDPKEFSTEQIKELLCK